MVKHFGWIIVLVMVLSIFSPNLVEASPAPYGPYTSTIRLQNMGTESAEVSVDFYDTNGNKVFTTPTEIIVPKDVLTIILPSNGPLASGEYSAVVNSTQPLASMTNFRDQFSDAAYSGFTEGSTSWFIPGLHDNYYSYYSSIYVQNVSNSPADITLDIYAPNNPVPVYSNTKSAVAPFASVSWDLKDMPELARNVTYGGTISATSEVVAVANIYGSGATARQLYSYNAFESGGTRWFTPQLMRNYYGWNAAIIIQNVSSENANVTVSFSTGLSRIYNIDPYSAITIYVPNLPLPSGRNGLFAAEITSNVDVVVMVNQSNTYNRAATYNAFSSGGTKVFGPSVIKRVSNFSTSFTCQNIGDGPTRMEIEYFGYPGASSTTASIPRGGTHLWYQPNAPLPNGYDGSAVVTSLDGEEIACIINRNMEESPYFTMSMDMLSSYNGISE